MKKDNLLIKYWYLIVFAIIIKGLFFFCFQYLKNPVGFNHMCFYSMDGDASDYVSPIENLVQYGEHRTDEGDYAIRMPGYTPVLLFFRLLFSLKWAINLTLFLQFIFSGISCFVLAILVQKLFNSQKIALSVFFIYLFSTYVSIWDTYILTESFATSALIFSFYFLIAAEQENKKYAYLFSGVFLTWCIFLRPFLLPVFMLFMMVILLNKTATQTVGKKVLNCCLLLLPFILAESSWVLRNYLNAGQLIFTQSRITYNDSGEILHKDLSIKSYVGAFSAAFGGDHTFWNPKGSTYWFFNEESGSIEDLFPEQIFNDSITVADFIRVKKECIALISDSLHEQTRIAYDYDAKSTLEKSLEHYIKENPIHYYVTSRFIHLKNFILHSGVYNIPFPAYPMQSIFQKIVKAFYSVLYLSIFVIGGLGCFILVKKHRSNPSVIVFLLIPVYIIFLFPFIFKVHEFRFNTLAYPFLAVCFVIMISALLKRVRKWKGNT